MTPRTGWRGRTCGRVITMTTPTAANRLWEPVHRMNKPFPLTRQAAADALYIPIAWEEGASEQGFPRCCGLMATP
jgi:hypothetical protein